jgi:hypothetical protein
VKFNVFAVMKIQVAVFWVVTPCSNVLGYQHFGVPCSFNLQGEVQMCPVNRSLPTEVPYVRFEVSGR